MDAQRKYEGVQGVKYPGIYTEVRETTEPAKPPPDDWVHLNEAAALLGKCRATARNLMDG